MPIQQCTTGERQAIARSSRATAEPDEEEQEEEEEDREEEEDDDNEDLGFRDDADEDGDDEEDQQRPRKVCLSLAGRIMRTSHGRRPVVSGSLISLF